MVQFLVSGLPFSDPGHEINPELFSELSTQVKMAVIYERVGNLTREIEARNRTVRNLGYIMFTQLLATISGVVLLLSSGRLH